MSAQADGAQGSSLRAAITFRPRTAADRDFLCALYASTREEEMRPIPWTDQQKAAFLAMQFEAQTQHYDEYFGEADFLIVESAGAPIGRLSVYRDDGELQVIDIALVPQWRGRGIGTALMQDLLDEARTTGRTVSIYVEHFNPARHLYDRLGFEHVDTNGVYHRMSWPAPRLK